VNLPYARVLESLRLVLVEEGEKESGRWKAEGILKGPSSREVKLGVTQKDKRAYSALICYYCASPDCCGPGRQHESVRMNVGGMRTQ
jgi:hypothetical protein